MKTLTVKFALLALALISTCPVHAKEQVSICAREGFGGTAYHVDATYLSGMELNTATSSFSYNSLAQYVVIFWKPNEASIIELAFPMLSLIPANGRDREGRNWQVWKFGGLCF